MKTFLARVRASKASHALAALVAALVTAGVVIDFTPDHHVVVRVGHTTTVPQVVVADPNQSLSPAEAKADAKPSTSDGIALHEDAKDETPPGVTPQELAAGKKVTNEIAHKELKAPENPAGAQNYRCSQHPVVNHSNLTHRIIGVALHFTVSPQGSHEAIWRAFNTPSFGASSTFLFEPQTSLCWQLVSLGQKSWAQLSANSYYWSIEIVTNNLTRAQWLATGMFRHGTLASLVADLLRKAGAPPKLVDPKGCVFLPGVTDHSRLECGNTHWDVGPNFPWDVFMKQVRQHYYGAAYKPACDAQCRSAKALRAKHLRTHQRIVKNRCAHGGKNHGQIRGGYCRTLRDRNAAVHKTARAKHVSLAGTYK